MLWKLLFTARIWLCCENKHALLSILLDTYVIRMSYVCHVGHHLSPVRGAEVAKLSIEGTVVQSLPPFRNLGSFVHLTFACVFRKRLKAGGGGPFCLVSMPGEVKDPTQEVNV